MANAVNWFEIPATDFKRAAQFYSEVYDAELSLVETNGNEMVILPYDQQGGVGGCVVYGEGREPSAKGTVVYLNGGADLDVPLSRVEAAGGKIVMPKTKVSDEIGYIAMFMDSEGNQVAFHSPPV